MQCVQNHSVHTMIVDEIGRRAEVLAAHTTKQRGIRLVASAHGDLRSLLRNPDLNGLLGGVVNGKRKILVDLEFARHESHLKLASRTKC